LNISTLKEKKDKELRIRELEIRLQVCRNGLKHFGDRKRTDGLLTSERITDLEAQLSDELKN
jgi:hypothetical protein